MKINANLLKYQDFMVPYARGMKKIKKFVFLIKTLILDGQENQINLTIGYIVSLTKSNSYNVTFWCPCFASVRCRRDGAFPSVEARVLLDSLGLGWAGVGGAPPVCAGRAGVGPGSPGLPFAGRGWLGPGSLGLALGWICHRRVPLAA